MFFEHFPVKYAKLFTELCCYNDKLVQGAPTSPAISNIIMLDFDNRVESYCKENNISYTRYCDDITLSADFSLDRTYHRIKKELQKAGFKLNKRKNSFCKKHTSTKNYRRCCKRKNTSTNRIQKKAKTRTILSLQIRCKQCYFEKQLYRLHFQWQYTGRKIYQ